MTTTLERLKPHPAAAIFPLLEGPAYADFKADIKAHGLLSPIELLDGQIIDGRNRYRACVELGIEPEVVDVHLNEGEDAVSYVVSLNLHRRHLEPGQLAMCAARAEKLRADMDEAAEVRMKRGKKDPADSGPQGSVVKERAPDTRTKIGKAFGVSGKSVDRAAKVEERGAAALVEAVEKGEVPLATAAKLAELPKAEQVEALKGGRKAIKEAVAAATGKRARATCAAVRDCFQKMQEMLERLETETGGPAKALKSEDWRHEENRALAREAQRVMRVLEKWNQTLSE